MYMILSNPEENFADIRLAEMPGWLVTYHLDIRDIWITASTIYRLNEIDTYVDIEMCVPSPHVI